MHQAVMDWLAAVKGQHPRLFRERRVLECGSFNVNGTPRPLFEGCDYTGLDARPGAGVDVVGLAHEYEAAVPFDVIISTEMLEHDPHWRLTLGRMVALLADGGSLLLTFAGPGRAAHYYGVSSMTGYYRNLEPAEVIDRVTATGYFREISVQDRGEDVYILFLEKIGEAGEDA